VRVELAEVFDRLAHVAVPGLLVFAEIPARVAKPAMLVSYWIV